MQTVLFIGLVWPEPRSSAAGRRIVQLAFLFRDAGYQVVFASAASRSAYSFPLTQSGIQEQPILLNDSSFDEMIRTIQPAIVVFDRFMAEEQYGWRVRECCPSALTILDTEDLHFVRRARQDAIKRCSEPNYYTEIAKRELAAILRTDISLIISRVEMELLQDVFAIRPEILYYLPFLEDEIHGEEDQTWRTFEERQHFLFIGNFMHEPNWHTVQILKSKVWPQLKKRVPEAELHIFGAYASDKVHQLHQPKDRFLVRGRADDARKTMENYRVLLAPIQFGAGIKGKFVDAMQSGTPSATTSVGAESMMANGLWNGVVEDDLELFIEEAAKLYQTQRIWQDAQLKGTQILEENFSKLALGPPFLTRIQSLSTSLPLHRQKNFLGQILQTQALNSTKYMSLWIEEKQRQCPDKGPK